MGIIDNVRNFFKGSNNVSVEQEEDTYKKSMLATKIVNLVDKIKRINSFDSSIWNLNNVSSYELERKSLDELEQLYSSLSSRLLVLTKQHQRESQEREAYEDAKWTGQKPENLTNQEFDRFQRYDR